jgi:Zn-dependent M28 family amino/carboxypeptidase/cytochrome c5
MSPLSLLRAARRRGAAVAAAAMLAGPAAHPAAAQSSVARPPAPSRATGSAERVDTAALARLEAAAAAGSQVMELVSWLTDVHGPRLTGSPQTRAAAEWAVRTMRGWGLADPRLEAWGPFGRGWSNERTVVHAVRPVPFPLIAYANAWTPGTGGAVSAEAVLVAADSAPDLARHRGQLRGKVVLLGAPRDVPARFEAQATRWTDAQLDSMARLPLPAAGGAPRPDLSNPASLPPALRERVRQQRLLAERLRFLADEGAAAALLQGRGDDGTVFVQSTGGSRDSAAAAPLPVVTVAAEHYGRLARTLAKGVPVTLEVDVRSTFHDADRASFNVLAELPGGDARLKDEVVMLGAHFDSWHAGTGATDNAAGSAVMMEAMRLLKASGVPLRRTVRLALWTGEEQGLLGSRAWVARHLGEPGAPTAAAGRVSAYYNLDNGTGKIRGVYLQGNAAAGPVFDAWLARFRDRGARTLTPANTGGTDHLAFDAVGVPGFQFIQDEIEYDTRTHHSNMDVYERVQPDDMRWNALLVAAFVLQTANRDALLPRKAPAAAAPARVGVAGGR